MPMLNNAIKEILRMHPPIHSILRKVKSPMRNGKYVIPAGYHVLASPGASAMDEKYFKNPKDFNPSRWEEVVDEAEKNAEQYDFGFGLVNKGTASPYLPFGAGRHRCIGENFANVQLGAIIATFIREFEFSLTGDGKVPPVDYTVCVPPSTCHWINADGRMQSMIAMPQPGASVNWVRRQ